MKMCVLGAGVVGVSTAFALARLGHEVSVIDKGADVACGASQANGAQLSYNYVDPFAGPQALRKMPAYLLGLDPGIRLGFTLSPDYLKWGLSFIRNCSSGAVRRNLLARWELAQSSQAALAVFESELPTDSIKRSGHGKLILANSDQDMADLSKSVASKTGLGFSLSVLSKAECLEREPSLAGWAQEFKGGLYSDMDTTLDPLVYCQALKAHAEQAYGVKFFWNETITSLQQEDGHISSVQTALGHHNCDQIVLCLGSDANTVLKPLGLGVPIYPMQGYSLTLPKGTSALSISLTDPKQKVVFANLENHIRIAGFVDANQKADAVQTRMQQLLTTAKRLWPDIADYEADPHYWTQFRPMMPSGVPVIGQSKIKGLYLNVGHGSLGYTFAAGSAMKIANAIGAEHMKAMRDKGGGRYEIRA